jgi:hypothetical protein
MTYYNMKAYWGHALTVGDWADLHGGRNSHWLPCGLGILWWRFILWLWRRVVWCLRTNFERSILHPPTSSGSSLKMEAVCSSVILLVAYQFILSLKYFWCCVISDVDRYVIIGKSLDSVFNTQGEAKSQYWRCHWRQRDDLGWGETESTWHVGH